MSGDFTINELANFIGVQCTSVRVVTFRTSAIDVKYVFNLLAIAFASFMRSLSKTSSSGNLLDVEFDPSFTFFKCFQMDLVSLEFPMQFVKKLRLACFISCVVLFRYLLKISHCLRRLLLSRKFCMCVMSGVNHSGKRLDFTLLLFTGA